MKKQVVDAVAEEVIQAQTEVSVIEQEVENIVNDVESDGDDVESDGNIFDDEEDIFADDGEDTLSKEDIIRKLLADKKRCKQYKGLYVRNVVYNIDNNGNTFFTFVVKEYVKGNIVVESEEGLLARKIGNTHNIVVGGYALSSVMKDSPKTAIFAAEILTDEKLANKLFVGSHIDIICQYVKANESYTNPFSTSATETSFDENKMIHHLTKVSLGEVGLDVYQARISR